MNGEAPAVKREATEMLDFEPGAPERCFPGADIEAYRAERFWPDEIEWTYLERWAESRGADLAVADGEQELTFGQFRADAARFAQGLFGLGVRAGDRIVVQTPNWVEGLVAFAGVHRLGAILVPQSSIYRAEELRYAIEKTEAEVLVVPGEHRGFDHAEMARGLRDGVACLREVVTLRSDSASIRYEDLVAGGPSYDGPLPTPDDVRYVIFTSGTTARPKACSHSSNTSLSNVFVLNEMLGMTDADVMFMPSPITHATGMTCAMQQPVVLGIPVVLQDRWDPEVALGLIGRYQCTLAISATPFLSMLADTYDSTRHDISSFRLFATGGAPVPGPVVSKVLDRLGCRVTTIYGGSEAGSATCTRLDDPPERAINTDGRPNPRFTMRLVDAEGADVATGEEGEILGKGPGRMLAYWGDPDLTAAVVDQEGWYRTGDLARADERGYIRITGRTKDIIIRGGLNLSALEIEELVLGHPRVRDVAVVGMPDERLGERACAFVVAGGTPALTLAEITALLDERGVARQKHPERLEVVDELPRSVIGKVDKRFLRERIAAIVAAEAV
jgi:non-ribosomal peptide synthetase component E (peptide arylation enzyme)